MNTIIIPYSGSSFKKNSKKTLSTKMILALQAAVAKQNAGIPYGPQDIKGSFSALIERGLIVRKEVVNDGKSELQWQATFAAIQLVKELGIS